MVGTVIGSGVFFRNDQIFAVIGGNITIGIAAWLVGGLIALSLVYVFSILSTKHEEAGGVGGLAEALMGEKFGYIFSWFQATIYFPASMGILAWVSGRFTVVLLGLDVNASFSAQTYLFALFYLIMIYTMNALGPKLAEKFHVTCTFIKVIPLIAMGIIGLAIGIVNETTVANINMVYTNDISGNPFFVSLVATAFAYVGWEITLNLNKEIINVKRNLPIALVSGMLIVMVIYILYFIGLFGAAPVEQLSSGAGVLTAFANTFTEIGGTVLFVFIIISCLGTLNGIVTATGRLFYMLAINRKGPKQELLSQVDAVTNMPVNSMTLGLLFSGVWVLIFAGHLNGIFNFDVPGLTPIMFNGLSIPILFKMMIKETSLNWFNRFIAPLVAISGASFLIYAAIYSQGVSVLWFLGVCVVVIFVGLAIKRDRKDHLSISSADKKIPTNLYSS